MEEARALPAPDHVALCERVRTNYQKALKRQPALIFAGVFLMLVVFGICATILGPKAPVPTPLSTACVAFLITTTFLAQWTVPVRATRCVERLLLDAADPRLMVSSISVYYECESDAYRRIPVHQKPGYQNLVKRLTTGSDPRLLPAVLVILAHTPSYDHSDQRKQLRSKALEWLSVYSPGEPLTEAERAPFVSVMNDAYRDWEITVAVIEAVARMGLTQAMHVMLKLTREGSATPHMHAVSTAAKKALPLLRAACEQELKAETLLRASGSPVAAEQELLRAAWDEKSVPRPDELLRAEVDR